MNKIVESFPSWLLPYLPLLCLAVYLAIDSWWAAYTRNKAYEELALLDGLRERGIVTQEEFDRKKEKFLCFDSIDGENA